MPSILLIHDNIKHSMKYSYMPTISHLYEIGSLHNTKGADSSFFRYYLSQVNESIKQKINTAIHVKRYGTIPSLTPFIMKPLHYKSALPFYKAMPYKYTPYKSTLYKSSSFYNTTYFSCPTRNRVFNIISNPASSIFLQNATSSEHMSTSSNPSFPRIR